MQPHIIVTEDEADVLHFLERALERIKPGARISTATNGAEALAIFQQHGCDLLISDHRMPQMSGLDLLIAVRSLSPVPFIMISADTMIGPRAHAAGVTEFLEKPIGLSVLRDAVLRCLP
jgi:CheY-like chemotaxis protein